MVVFRSDNGGPTQELTSSNAPLKSGKGSLYEGGIRVPFVWSCPEHLPSRGVDDRPVTSLDIAATALDLAGLPIDEKADGVSVLGWLHKPGTATTYENIF